MATTDTTRQSKALKSASEKNDTPQAIRAKLDGVAPDLRVLYVNHQNAIQLRDNLRQLGIAQCTSWRGGSNPHNANQQITQLMAFQQSETAGKLAALDSMVAALESSPDLELATKTVAPLLKALANAEHEEQEAQRRAVAAKNEFEAKKAAAMKAAAEKVEAEFSTT